MSAGDTWSAGIPCPLIRRPCPTVEAWAPCHEHDGYEVSSWGKVRNRKTGRVLKPLHHPKGYLAVNLGASKRNRLIHRLVMFAFVGPPPRDGFPYQVDHFDFDRRRNVAHNLRWLRAHLNRFRWLRDQDDVDPAELAKLDDSKVPTDAELKAAGW